jgi:L-iditol 2-dehydrogenase
MSESADYRFARQGPTKMLVARLHTWSDIRIESMPIPAPVPGEIVIRIDACGLCGSDALDWYVARKAPVVLGHEPVGRITAVGDGVDHLHVGQRVFVHHHAPCMQCAECERRLWSNCATWRATQLDPGGFAQYARVPAVNVQHDVLALPDALSDVAATFIEPVACCLRALARGRLQPRDRLLIVGLGAMGLLLAGIARALSCGRVFGTDFIAARRERAAARGVIALDAAAAPQEEIRRLTENRGADVVIVTPGAAAAVRAGIAAAAPGGRVVCFTPLPPDAPLELDQSQLYFREIELLQSYSCGPDETREALALLASGVLDVESLVTHHVDLDGVAGALDRAHRAEGLKTVVYPHGVPAQR